MEPAVSRRRFLGGGAAAVVSTAVGGTFVASCTDDADPLNAADTATTTSTTFGPTSDRELAAGQRYAFEGVHQSGVVTPAQEHAIVVAFDSVASEAAELEQLFRAMTQEIRVLMAGTPAADLDPLLPPADNLIVGVEPPADDLTITVGIGATLFDHRYGLAGRRPRQLVTMPTFPNDKPDIAQLHGDIVVQICARTPETCNHVLRRIMRATRESLVLRWLTPGFNRPNTLGIGRASTRNLLGFKDGTANPDHTDEATMTSLVWVAAGDDEPDWTTGGTYQAVRLIRNRVEFWDRTSLRTQETIIGRTKATGAPLDGTEETDVPGYAADPNGKTFRLDGHIRLANPRTAETERNLILRRGFSYSAGFDRAGQLNQGLLFVCFQRSLEDGFLAVQNRLNGEALEEYITPFGGGLFFVLPGVTSANRFFADTLFDAAP